MNRTCSLIVAYAAAVTLCLPRAAASADYRNMIGYYDLPALGTQRAPTGAGTIVCQVEAGIGADPSRRHPSAGDWLPDVHLGEFSDKVFLPFTPEAPDIEFSRHATVVGRLLYGSQHSIAPGISQVQNYEARDWLTNVLMAGRPLLPKSPGCRIANHSWIAKTASAELNGDILRRTDWLSEHTGLIQVVGIGNSQTAQPLLGSAFNVIPVGRTDGHHSIGTTAVDPVYGGGRAQPLIVAPMDSVSAAVPVVAAAAAVLVDFAHRLNVANPTDLIKAILMAGADRRTRNGSGAEISDYRARPEQRTDNGLDRRYGAGQVNIANSYGILAAAWPDRKEARPVTSARTPLAGFEYKAHFGGADGSLRSAAYRFGPAPRGGRLAASLAWEMQIAPSIVRFKWTTRLNNLDLELYDLTDGHEVARSASTDQNTENLYVDLTEDHDYELRVTVPRTERLFDGAYAVAWRVFDENPKPPLPSLWLLPAIAALLLLSGAAPHRRRRTP